MRYSNARLEIDLDNLLYNLEQIRRTLPERSPIIAVVKDNAYGLGAGPIGRTLEENGVSFFAVARPEEAAGLRHAGVRSPVLILGALTHEELNWAAAHEIRVTINGLDDLNDWLRKPPARPLIAHVNIDTGMERLGVKPAEMHALTRALARHKDRICLEGAYTHFACADIPDTPTVDRQLALLRRSLSSLEQSGFAPAVIHAPNSAAIMRFPGVSGWSARPGIALYGCKPDPGQQFSIALRPVAALKAPVIKVKRVEAGAAVSYGATWTAQRPVTIATVAVGYAHGYPRALSGQGEALIRGQRFPVAGRVTMDYIMVDVGDYDIRVGDDAVVMGTQGEESIPVDTIARQCNTIGYEILCGLNPRTDRYYLRNGSVVEIQKGFMY